MKQKIQTKKVLKKTVKNIVVKKVAVKKLAVKKAHVVADVHMKVGEKTFRNEEKLAQVIKEKGTHIHPAPASNGFMAAKLEEKDQEFHVKPLDIKKEQKLLKFRVAIFGSARIKKGDKVYKEVFNLSKHIAKNGFDVITGGGPGLMEAANAGHNAGDKEQKANSIGLVITLPFENKPNGWVEVEKSFYKFSNRLETFLSLLSVAVITKGGLGTLLELSYMWQYTQVGKIERFPIILIGKQWEKLLVWFRKYVLPENLMSNKDFDNIFVVKNNREAMKLIRLAHADFLTKKGTNKPVLKSKLYQR